MRIEYICHATLLLEIDGIKLVTDPWVLGSAYADQWHLFPKPLDGAVEKIKDVDYVLLSHGHEDHLHEATLKRINRSAKVLFPYTWYGNATHYFKTLGFADNREVKSGSSVQLTKDLTITYLSHNLDSIVVIEHKGKVWVNVNDALHATSDKAIDYFTGLIRERWKTIDQVFCGFGGASHFPNCFHAEGKDDVAIARTRESMFVTKFIRIVQALRPRTAVPFAADFVLLGPETKWINGTRINRSLIPEIYAATVPDPTVTILPLYPGDVLVDHEVVRASPYRADLLEGSLNHLIVEQYGDEMKAQERIDHLSTADADALFHKLGKHLGNKLEKSGPGLDGVRFNLRVVDLAEDQNIHMEWHGNSLRMERGKAAASDHLIDIHTRSRILHYSMDSDWGGDCITIGYGLQVYIKNGKVMQDSLIFRILDLLTRLPKEKRAMVNDPLRALQFIVANEIHRDFFWKTVTRDKNTLRNELYAKDSTYDLPQWLSKDKCEICRICSIPDLEEKYFN